MANLTDNQTGIPKSSNEQVVVFHDEQISRMAKQIECMQAELERIKGSSDQNESAFKVSNSHDYLPQTEMPLAREIPVRTTDREYMIRKMKSLEHSLKNLQGSRGHQSISYRNLYLYPDVAPPPGFKVPKFDMYNGHSDPFAHLTKYLNRMRGAGGKEKLLVAYFSHSLEGVAAEWFARQDISKWHEFDDIANDFIEQFKYNVDMVPDLITLSNLKKKSTETFREYALRWREQAARVQPPMSEEDMVKYFIRAQDDSYYMHLLPMMGNPFSKLLMMGEMVEEGIKTGRIVSSVAMNATTQAIQTGSGNFEKREREDKVGIAVFDIDHRPNKKPTFINSLNQPSDQSYPSQYQIPPAPYPVYNTQLDYSRSGIPSYQPYSQPPAYNYPQQHQLSVARKSMPSGPCPKREKRQRRKFTSLGEPRAQLYERLKDMGVLNPLAGDGTFEPSPECVDGAKYCAYHAEFAKHDTEECVLLKHKIQDLIENNTIQLREPTPGDLVMN